MSNTTSTRKVINKLKKLHEYQNNIDQDFLSKSLEWIEKRAIKNLDETVNKDFPHPTSFARDYMIIINGNSAKLVNTDPNSAAMEFGIGIEGKVSPHKLAQEQNYKYDVNNHNVDGWSFTLPNGKRIITWGYGAKSFMYKALVEYMDSKQWLKIYQKLIDKKLRRLSK